MLTALCAGGGPAEAADGHGAGGVALNAEQGGRPTVSHLTPPCCTTPSAV